MDYLFDILPLEMGVVEELESKSLKVVVVGSGGVGKSCLLISYITNAFPTEYIPTVFDNYSDRITYDGEEVNLGLWDTAGQEDYDRLRPLSYPGTDVYLICFSLASRVSFDAISTKWVPELQRHSPGVPYILVGTKSDLVGHQQVSHEEANELRRRINAHGYLSISALTQYNLAFLFQDLIPSVAIGYSKNIQYVKDAVMNGDEVPWRRCKLMIIGQGRSGKTSLVRSLLGQPFVEDLQSTVTASLKQINTDVCGNGWDEADDSIAFTTDLAVRAGVKRYNKINNNPSVTSTQNTSSKKGSTLASSVSSLFDSFRKSKTTYTSQTPQKNHKKPAFDEMEAVRAFNSNLFLSMSKSSNDATDALSLTIWDYGGQTVFYTLHHLFLTKYGIYIMVFDMREAISNEGSCVDYLRFWLSSVKLHAPAAPVVAVGTFSAAIESDDELKEIDKIFKTILDVKDAYPQLCTNGNLHFIPVDNKTGHNVSAVREKIETLAKQQDFVHQGVSLRWTKVLDEMLEHQGDRSNWLEWSHARKIAAKYEIDNELDIMLDFFHELGVIVHLNATEALRNIIVIKPQWLLEKLGKVIWDLDVHGGFYDTAEIRKVGLEKELFEFTDKGIISRDLLEYLWSGEQVDFLLDLMRRTLLLSDWGFNAESGDVRYLVPSMVSNGNFADAISGSKCVLNFEEASLPEGVFQVSIRNTFLRNLFKYRLI